MIIFDLEWNSGRYESLVLDEVIQIGAVKIACPGGPITGTFNAYIKPRAHKRYSPAVEKLPQLADCEASALTFPMALETFAAWCGGDSQFASWGGADLGALKQNIRYYGLDDPTPDTFYDLQAAFGKTVGAKGNVALCGAVEYCAIPQSFDFHGADNDAMYTALVTGYISPGDLADSIRGVGQRKKKKPDQRRPGKPPRMGPGEALGPFEDRDSLLNDHGCRLGVCPECGETMRVGQWCWSREDVCYSRFACPTHGAFLLKLESGERKGSLWARRRVVELTGADRDAYRTAKRENIFLCRGDRRSRRKRKRRRSGGKRGSRQREN